MNPASATLVIARYQEDLEWITGVPEHFKIIIYNKGPLIESLSALQRADVIETRDNVGRESETMIHHMMKHRDETNEWTVFCQGDPFEHSPDFLDLLKEQESWCDIQSLACEWNSSKGIPPRYLLDFETGEFIDDLRVRSEVFSLHLWTASRFADPGSLGHRESYAKIHDLPEGANMAAHFLMLAGLPEIAMSAEAADCGRFSYGAIFAIRSRLLRSIPESALHKMMILAKGPVLHAYVFERLWLHIFGAPFLSLKPGFVTTGDAMTRVGSTSKVDAKAVKIFTTITPPYVAPCEEWLVSSLREVEPDAELNIECFDEVTGDPDFQSTAFQTHNQHRNRKLVEWIRENTGSVVFLTDADIIYMRPFMQILVDELGSADLACSLESLNGGFNIGQVAIRCSKRTAEFFERIGEEMKRGAWDQEAVNRLLPTSCLKFKALSRRFAITAVWKQLSPRDRANVVSYHATGTDARDGKSSLELKRECFARVREEWLTLQGCVAK